MTIGAEKMAEKKKKTTSAERCADHTAKSDGKNKKSVDTADKKVTDAIAEEELILPENERIETLEKELAEQKDLFLRKAAEFENYKNRTRREAERIGSDSRAAVIKKLLPVIDNFARANENPDVSDGDYRKGVEMTIRQFEGIIKDIGVEQINPVGEVFDPTLHYAVSQTEDESLGKNTVSAVMQCGYKMGDNIIRPAMVAVANCD